MFNISVASYSATENCKATSKFPQNTLVDFPQLHTIYRKTQLCSFVYTFVTSSKEQEVNIKKTWVIFSGADIWEMKRDKWAIVSTEEL